MSDAAADAPVGSDRVKIGTWSFGHWNVPNEAPGPHSVRMMGGTASKDKESQDKKRQDKSRQGKTAHRQDRTTLTKAHPLIYESIK